MNGKPKNHGTPWTDKEKMELIREAIANLTTSIIARRHARTVSAIRDKAQDLESSLSDTNKSRHKR